MIIAKTHRRRCRAGSGRARRLFLSLALSLAVQLTLPAAATADTDYRCLSACKRNGGTTPHCMTDCAFHAPPPSQPAVRPEGEAHKEFAAPVPAGQVLILKPKSPELPAGSAVTTQPVCLQTCLKEKLQYHFCSERCTRLRR